MFPPNKSLLSVQLCLDLVCIIFRLITLYDRKIWWWFRRPWIDIHCFHWLIEVDPFVAKLANSNSKPRPEKMIFLNLKSIFWNIVFYSEKFTDRRTEDGHRVIRIAHMSWKLKNLVQSPPGYIIRTYFPVITGSILLTEGNIGDKFMLILLRNFSHYCIIMHNIHRRWLMSMSNTRYNIYQFFSIHMCMYISEISLEHGNYWVISYVLLQPDWMKIFARQHIYM